MKIKQWRECSFSWQSLQNSLDISIISLKLSLSDSSRCVVVAQSHWKSGEIMTVWSKNALMRSPSVWGGDRAGVVRSAFLLLMILSSCSQLGAENVAYLLKVQVLAEAEPPLDSPSSLWLSSPMKASIFFPFQLNKVACSGQAQTRAHPCPGVLWLVNITPS